MQYAITVSRRSDNNSNMKRLLEIRKGSKLWIPRCTLQDLCLSRKENLPRVKLGRGGNVNIWLGIHTV